MITVLLLIHMFVTLALIGVVLIQRNEGGGLGIGSSQGMGAFMTGRGTANLLTRTTGVLAAIFLALSLTLALMSRNGSGGRSILDLPASSAPVLPGLAPASPPAPGAKPPAAAVPTPAPAPAKPAGSGLPATPAGPAVPTN
jgi:preprotein translocase subunit SecG